MNNNYYKYLKYKKKYLKLKKQFGGDNVFVEYMSGLGIITLIKINNGIYKNKSLLLGGYYHDQLRDTHCSYCDESKNCYTISKYIEKISQYKCIDLFQELHLSSSIAVDTFKNMKHILSYVDKYNHIIDSDIILSKQFQLSRRLLDNFINKSTQELYAKGLSLLGDKLPKYRELIYKLYIYILDFDKMKKYITDKKMDFNYLNTFINDIYITLFSEEYKIKAKYGQITKYPNIRNHYFDFRVLFDSYTNINELLTPLSFFPSFVDTINKKSDDIIELYLKDFKKYISDNIDKFTDIVYFFVYHNYIKTNDNKDILVLYKKGKEIYDSLFSIYLKYFNDTKLNDINIFYEIIDIYSHLIYKQIEKTQFPKGFVETFIYSLKNIDTLEDMDDVHLYGLFFTELYSIPRMFKIMENKRPRDDLCDNSMNNIIYLAGISHTQFLEYFFKQMFDDSIEISIFNKKHNGNYTCIDLKGRHILL